ncbi:TPA: type-F conjugative transfer system pilin chaperone TraQ, partial [Escherichia coli]
MISKYRFSLPRLDITGMWVFSLGVWFHIVARLVYSKPWMAFFLAELIAAILVLFIDRNLNPQKTKKAPQNGCFFNT